MTAAGSSGRPSTCSSSPRPRPSGHDRDEIPGCRVDRRPVPQRERRPGLEVRLGDDDPPSRRHLPDDAAGRRFGQARASARTASRRNADVRRRRPGRATSGVIPRPSTGTCPASRNRATVSLSAPPPASGSIAWTVPLPKLRSPTTIAPSPMSKRPGGDLGGARGRPVDQDDQRELADRGAVRIERLLRLVEPDRADDDAVVDEHARDGHRLRQEPARVAAQVEDEAVGVTLTARCASRRTDWAAEAGKPNRRRYW